MLGKFRGAEIRFLFLAGLFSIARRDGLAEPFHHPAPRIVVAVARGDQDVGQLMVHRRAWFSGWGAQRLWVLNANPTKAIWL